MTAAQEKEIINRILGGDSAAFEELYTANEKNVYNLALKLTGNEQDALDVSQEAFLSAYRRLAGFRFESRFSVWLYRLTYNSAVDLLRKRSRRREQSLTMEDDTGGTTELEVPDERSTPEKIVLREQTHRTILSSIKELGEKHRDILIMREITGMSYSAIASALGLSEGTVKSRIARARKSLTEILTRKGTFPEGFRHKEQKEVGERE